jgi:hypothetical protein
MPGTRTSSSHLDLPSEIQLNCSGSAFVRTRTSAILAEGRISAIFEKPVSAKPCMLRRESDEGDS